MTCRWPAAPAEPDLSPDVIHVWCAPLDLPPAAIEGLWPTLSEDERQRAARFRMGQLRNRFVAGRGTLRWILARYLKMEPGRFQFEYQPRGKPVLASPWNDRGIQFNTSHSHEMALYGVALDRPVGVDVEWTHRATNVEGLVERVFSEDERRQWDALPAEGRSQAFFRVWTRKEAWLKATGSGLSFPLQEISVSMAAGEAARLASIHGRADEAAQWWLDSCEPSPGYVGALATQQGPCEVRYWSVPPIAEPLPPC